MSFRIRPFRIDDQRAVRQLVLDGLGEHFGFIDESLNPDLDDIQAMYIDRGHLFVVARMDGSLAGTGALIEESGDVARLVRMSVTANCRGRGVGKALVEHLLAAARQRGYKRVVCETNHDWHDAIALYLACGFRETGARDGDRPFEIALT
ncbi:MAG: GNAT family N-acetyltransferase [Thermomicrobiales bacterium]